MIHLRYIPLRLHDWSFAAPLYVYIICMRAAYRDANSRQAARHVRSPGVPSIDSCDCSWATADTAAGYLVQLCSKSWLPGTDHHILSWETRKGNHRWIGQVHGQVHQRVQQIFEVELSKPPEPPELLRSSICAMRESWRAKALSRSMRPGSCRTTVPSWGERCPRNLCCKFKCCLLQQKGQWTVCSLFVSKWIAWRSSS